MSGLNDALYILKELRKEYWEEGTGLHTDYYITMDDIDRLDKAIEILERQANDVTTDEKQCNLPVVTAPLLWKDVLDDFYVEHDKQISSGEYKGKMILVFRDWLEQNYQVPERNGR